MSNQVNLNIDELKGFLGHIITNNRYLQASNKKPVAVEVVGESGIGKTSAILDIAKENNLHFVKINLAQIEELGDLVGFPTKQYQIYRTVPGSEKDVLAFNTAAVVAQKKEAAWVDELAVDSYLKSGYKMTGKSRMSYCAPEWIADKKEGGILLLDDWNRCDLRFTQATMELN